MIAFISANIGTIVVGLVLLVIVGAIIRNMINNKKKGKSSCGCGCEGCSHKCH
jgi:hypothetical protein